MPFYVHSKWDQKFRRTSFVTFDSITGDPKPHLYHTRILEIARQTHMYITGCKKKERKKVK